MQAKGRCWLVWSYGATQSFSSKSQKPSMPYRTSQPCYLDSDSNEPFWVLCLNGLYWVPTGLWRHWGVDRHQHRCGKQMLPADSFSLLPRKSSDYFDLTTRMSIIVFSVLKANHWKWSSTTISEFDTTRQEESDLCLGSPLSILDMTRELVLSSAPSPWWWCSSSPFSILVQIPPMTIEVGGAACTEVSCHHIWYFIYFHGKSTSI